MKIGLGYTVENKILIVEEHKLPIKILKPDSMEGESLRPVVLWLHGGGYAFGDNRMVYVSRAMNLVRKFGAVVICPNYRLSGEAPYPAALIDCYATLKYIKEHASELGVRSDQIMVGGESAGGGLTVALCMLARDVGEINIAYQMPLYPMIDDRFTASSIDNHAPVWNTKRNRAAWLKYLRNVPFDQVPIYAAPARQTDYTNLPPAYTFVGDIEPFYDETIQYIENLKAAGVEANLDVYPNCYHAFDLLYPLAKVSKQASDNFDAHFAYAINNYFVKQK
ncbi:alpha/beta hydrolase [Mollicutes bacterium LVI A0039]|nr:alpha/beta hydrolase [Mollicutes bacterium LVI A0039]